MSWVKLATLLAQLALMIFQYLERQRLLNEGERKAIRDVSARLAELVRKADEAASRVSDNLDDIVRDPANRDLHAGSGAPEGGSSGSGSV